MESCLYSIKHCEKWLPLKYSSCRERSYFPRVRFLDLRIRFWGTEIKHLKAHDFVWQGCVFFHYYLATSRTNWVQSFTGLLFCAYNVEIHQVRILVFDNCQRCPVSVGMIFGPWEIVGQSYQVQKLTCTCTHGVGFNTLFRVYSIAFFSDFSQGQSKSETRLN